MNCLMRARWNPLLAALLLWVASAGGVAAATPVKPDTITQPDSFMVAMPPADPALVAEGRRLYVDGVRADGSLLVADRQDLQPLQGGSAACVACHKRSGMGGMEGDVIVPPINGPSLYAGQKLRERTVIAMDPRRGRFLNQSHAPYDLETLGAAIRSGVHVSGRTMHVLMPRYHVSDHEVAALKAYLDQLSAKYPPGVTDHTAHFATVIAPGIDPDRKDAFLKSLNALLDQKNSNTLPGHRHMVSAAEGMLNLERTWSLDIWELQGDPSTWTAQLQADYDRNPPLAILSGLGDGEWQPVQDFCESQKMPCWFPSVANPPANAGQQTYSFYFSGGVRLEARVLAQYLGDLEDGQRPKRIIQVLQDDPAARAAADAFSAAAPGYAPVVRRMLGQGGLTLPKAIEGLGPQDALVLWLRPAALAELSQLPAPGGRAYASAELTRSQFEGIAAPWLSKLEIIYPYELPDKRVFNMATFRSWVALRQIPLVDEAMQSEVFFSVGYLMYTMTEMLDNIFRDCLIDRGETMVRRREMLRAEEETMVRQGGHPPAKSVQAKSSYAPGAIFGTNPNGVLAQKNSPKAGVQQGTTIYPHLELATGQRFASKGAYLVHLEGDPGMEVFKADSDWIVP